MIPIIDMHCDTIYAIYKQRCKGREISLRNNDLHVDLVRMKESGYMGQCFAMFTYLPEILEAGIDPLDYAKALLDILDEELKSNEDLIRPALTAQDIRQNYRDGLLSCIRTIEEGAVYKGDLNNIRYFYDRGVRKSTLTWNFENELAFPNRAYKDPVTGEYHVTPETERGLKKAGRDAVQLMEELDPHTPVIASHSNARAVTAHPRNLTDKMLRCIAEHGGVTGINFCADFLTSDGKGVSRVSDMIAHIEHIRNAAGIDAIGLGTDFDGIDDTLEISGAGRMQMLADALSLSGFTEDEIEKIFWRNVMRVYEEVL